MGERSEIVVVAGSEPLSWNAAKLEIEHQTDKGKEILEILTNLKII